MDNNKLWHVEESHYAWLQLAHAGYNRTYVGGEGARDPIAMVIGEAPGGQEVIRGRPFVGPAGVAQRDLMALADLRTHPDRLHGLPDNDERSLPANTWLTNVIKFRPPLRDGSRAPTSDEIREVRHLLREEWEAVGKPRLIICVGGVALEAVTGKRISILRAGGKAHWYTNREGVDMAIWPMVHPAFGLRNPSVQPLLEKDWEKLGVWRVTNRHVNW